MAPTPMDRERTSGVAPTPSTRYSSMNRGCATPVTSEATPVPRRSTATLAGSNEGDGVVVAVGVTVEAGDDVTAGVPVDTGVWVVDDEDVGVTVSAGDGVSAAVPVAVLVAVATGEPVMDADNPYDTDGVPVETGVPVSVLLGDGVAVGVPVREPVCVLVSVGVPVCVPVDADVSVQDGVDVRVTVDAGVPVHDGHAASTTNGAAVTPRNTVLVGAVASTEAALVAVLKEYSLVGEVA